MMAEREEASETKKEGAGEKSISAEGPYLRSSWWTWGSGEEERQN
jgi:hypothetical protein